MKCRLKELGDGGEVTVFRVEHSVVISENVTWLEMPLDNIIFFCCV